MGGVGRVPLRVRTRFSSARRAGSRVLIALLAALLLAAPFASPARAETPRSVANGSPSESGPDARTPLDRASPADPTMGDVELLSRAAKKARQARLIAVLAARRQVEVDLRELQRELASASADGRGSEIEGRMQARAGELASLSRSFSELATGIDPLLLEEKPAAAQFELSREVRVLLAPLINELKRATSRPREIDQLRTEITELQSQLATIDRALAQIEAFEKTAKDADLLKALAVERKDWMRRRAAVDTTFAVAREKLEQRTAEVPSLRDAVQDVFAVFFKSRGRNLLLALVATAGFLFLLRRVRHLFASHPRFAGRDQSFGSRVANLVYSVFTVVGAVGVFILALYFFGDWVLLILALLLLLGLVWASKQALPRFWSQAVLFLDMGAVREGQRVIYGGLAWRVESISFYCVLVNPELVGGRLRIPIADLEDMRSRADRDDEPWFPTREGDVVLLEGARAAIVEFQSIESVRLRVSGGNRISVPTATFASEPHEILSRGYRVDLQFGLDYQSQSDITMGMRERLETELERRWRSSRWASSFVSLAVEFSAAGPSSLDYFVRVDLDGSQALDWSAQRRLLASLCVDVCNESGWNIPFPQLTVHVAPNPGE